LLTLFNKINPFIKRCCGRYRKIIRHCSKDNAKEKVKTFMKEIASAYKLTASTPEINDNGDGSANVSFEVEALIPIDPHTVYKPSPRSGYVKSITGVNLADLVSTGLNIKHISGGKLYISCEKGEKC